MKTKKNVRPGLLIVLSAPSGGGKSTLIRELRKRHPEIFYSVSVTTRPARGKEKEGEDYHFATEAQFERKKNAGQLLEWAFVHGAWYGTPRTPIEKQLKSGGSVILDIDVQGGKKVKALFPEAVLVFIMPPSIKVLEERLRGRSQDNEATIQRRLRAARHEIAQAKTYDYLVLNDEIHHAVEKLENILKAERLRMQRSRLPQATPVTA